MTEIGYALSSEEHGPNTLVENATAAEDAGFEFALVSDHFHPWTTTQGNAPFVWNVLGGIATATDSLEVGTGVTCPTIRIHPAILAQATATTAEMFDDRFFFGIGTGENLNEHVLGDHWPSTDLRLEMMAEAVEVIRKLWTGENVTYYGDHYTVENARLFTVPDDEPPIYVSATGPKAASDVQEYAEGLINTSPDDEVVETYEDGGGGGPHYGQVTICYADDEPEARETAYEWWPNVALPGELGQLLPTPKHFEQATSMVTEDDVAEKVVHGPDPDTYVDAIEEYADAGYDHVYVHQVGPNQTECLEFFEREVLPSF